MQLSLSGLTVRIGTDDRIRVDVTDENGSAVDLTSATITGYVKRFRTDPDSAAVTQLVVDENRSNKAQGQLALGFQSDLPAPGVYVVDVRIVLTDQALGSVDNVVGEALLEAYYPVTRQ